MDSFNRCLMLNKFRSGLVHNMSHIDFLCGVFDLPCHDNVLSSNDEVTTYSFYVVDTIDHKLSYNDGQQRSSPPNKLF